jgi:type II secretion system protein C
VAIGAMAIAFAAAGVQAGLDIRWALAASGFAASGGPTVSSTGTPVVTSRTFQNVMNAHLFGLASAPGGRLTAASAPRDTTLVLTGTIATASPTSGFALIGASAETANVHPVGDSLQGGAVLRAVYRDYVIVEQAGQLGVVYFPRGGKGALTAAAIRSHVSPRSAENDVDSEQAQRQQIEEAVEAESERTAAFLRQQPFYSDDQLRGIALEPGSDPGMLAQLGLKAGDVLEFVDGSPIAQPDRLDWLRQRLQSGQAVELSVIRPGSGEVDVKIPGGAVTGMIEN